MSRVPRRRANAASSPSARSTASCSGGSPAAASTPPMRPTRRGRCSTTSRGRVGRRICWRCSACPRAAARGQGQCASDFGDDRSGSASAAADPDRRHGGRPACGDARPGLLHAGHAESRPMAPAASRCSIPATERVPSDEPAADDASPIGSTADAPMRSKARSSSPARRCNGCATGSASHRARRPIGPMAAKADPHPGRLSGAGLHRPRRAAWWDRDARGAMFGPHARHRPRARSSARRWNRSASQTRDLLDAMRRDWHGGGDTHAARRRRHGGEPTGRCGASPATTKPRRAGRLRPVVLGDDGARRACPGWPCRQGWARGRTKPASLPPGSASAASSRRCSAGAAHGRDRSWRERRCSPRADDRTIQVSRGAAHKNDAGTLFGVPSIMRPNRGARTAARAVAPIAERAAALFHPRGKAGASLPLTDAERRHYVADDFVLDAAGAECFRGEAHRLARLYRAAAGRPRQ